jgi:DNA helicase-2/ATP-dependent DNA helicase PcrA
VVLMTIHSAKGLEFPCVFVVGLEEDLFPNTMSMSSREDLEEERRLFYVAITRAKHKLTLSFAGMRYRFGNPQYNEPSRFLDEIDPAVLEVAFTHHEFAASSREEKFSKVTVPIRKEPQYNHKPSSDFAADDFNLIQTGMEVEHQRFGIGKVIHLEGNSKEKIMLRYAKLRIVKKDLMSEG